jgi:rubrerythrin
MRTDCQAIEMGMQLEREGRQFYLEAAERTENARGKQMFLSLADDEATHLRILERQLKAVQSGNRCLVLSEVEDVESGWSEPLYPKDPDILKKVVRPEANDADALIFAIQAENKSFELYREMANTSEDPAAVAMFKWLAEAERGHFNQLMLSYESLITQGHWA